MESSPEYTLLRPGDKISASQLKPHPLNPRVIYEKESLDDLAKNIQEHGGHPIQPILVRPLTGEYQIVDGTMKFKALTTILGWKEFEIGTDVVVRPMDDKEAIRVMVDSKLKRWEYEPAEAASAIILLTDYCGLTETEIAFQYGVHKSQISRLRKVAELPDEVKRKIRWGKARLATRLDTISIPGESHVAIRRQPADEGIVTVRHAEFISRLDTRNDRIQVSRAIERYSLTVKETARVVELRKLHPQDSVDELANAARTSSVSPSMSSLIVEIRDSRVAEALKRAVENSEKAVEQYAAEKVAEGLVNDGFLKPEVLRELEYLAWSEGQSGKGGGQ